MSWVLEQFSIAQLNSKRQPVVTSYHLTVTFSHLISSTQNPSQPNQLFQEGRWLGGGRDGKATPRSSYQSCPRYRQNLRSLQLFSVSRVREPWRWWWQFSFTLSCLKSTAGLTLSKCLLSHILRRWFFNSNKYFQSDIEQTVLSPNFYYVQLFF